MAIENKTHLSVMVDTWPRLVDTMERVDRVHK